MKKIAATEAKAKFSEILERTRNGEDFSITLHGREVARLVPARCRSLQQVQDTIAEMRANRFVFNPRGAKRLRLKDLIDQGRR